MIDEQVRPNQHHSLKWRDRITCPRCASSVLSCFINPRCSNECCEYHAEMFPVISGQPVLIDFKHSVFRRDAYRHNSGSVLSRDTKGRSFGSRLHQFTFGKNPIAALNCSLFISILKQFSKRPTVLVIGGAKIGSGADLLYSDPLIELVGTDVFASDNTVIVADAHRIPFADGTFDAIWIQAVLEHVLEPITVVAEIHRVLRPSGLVYAETPFMQQVHEQAYDFTRFTQSGHRWLFRHFSEISAGPVSGPGVALLWSIRYFARSLGASNRVSRIFPLPFFWLRFFDLFSRGRSKADGASGLFFLGRRADQSIDPAYMPDYYNNQV